MEEDYRDVMAREDRITKLENEDWPSAPLQSGVMREIQYFKAIKQTNRFNKNQKVWVRLNLSNHLHVWFKWRGKGRYVSGVIDKYDNSVGEIKTIEVNADFAKRVEGENA